MVHSSSASDIEDRLDDEKRCCCCCDPRTGIIVATIFFLIAGAWKLIVLASGKAQFNTTGFWKFLDFLMFIVGILGSLIGLYGAAMYNLRALCVFYYWYMVSVVFRGIMMVITVIQIMSAEAGDASLAGTKAVAILWTLGVYGLWLFLEIHILCVANAYMKVLEDHKDDKQENRV